MAEDIFYESPLGYVLRDLREIANRAYWLQFDDENGHCGSDIGSFGRKEMDVCQQQCGHYTVCLANMQLESTAWFSK